MGKLSGDGRGGGGGTWARARGPRGQAVALGTGVPAHHSLRLTSTGAAAGFSAWRHFESLVGTGFQKKWGAPKKRNYP